MQSWARLRRGRCATALLFLPAANASLRFCLSVARFPASYRASAAGLSKPGERSPRMRWASEALSLARMRKRRRRTALHHFERIRNDEA